MARRRWFGAGAVLVALSLVAAGCGDDDDDGAAAPDAGGQDAGSATVEIEMVDFGYVVSGPLGTGVQTIETTNTGAEIHMVGLGRLKDGVTLADVTAALTGGDEEPEEGGGEEGGDGPGEGEEGGEGEDPFDALFEEEIGSPGHILFPGVTQRITLEDDLDVGTYALICFIPGEGDGVPHFAKGMISELQVVEEGGTTDAPDADGEYRLPDEAEPEGTTEISAGEVTLKVTNDGDIGKDVIVGQVDGDLSVMDEYFVETFEGEGPPPVGAAGQVPGTIAGMSFEVAPGATIYLTVELSPGTWHLVSVNNVEGEDGEETTDYALELTVT